MFQILLFCLTLMLSLKSNAAVQFVLDEPCDYTVQERTVIRTYFKTTEGLLPPTFNLKNNDPILVSFADFKSRPEDLLNPTAQGHIMGHVKFELFARHSRRLVLNKNLILLFGDAKLSVAPALRHRNGKTLALATLLHESAHLFDFDAEISQALRSEIQACRKDSTIETKEFKTCAEALAMKGKISQHPDFVRQQRWAQISTSNAHPRSPNPYEYQNANEYFAVNFEYFLLDPEFACRRPTLARTFRNLFKYQPFGPNNCQFSPEIFVSETGAVKNIRPDHVIAIHYLHAGEGQAMMSRWGHSMFKLSLCETPKSQLVGPCPTDQSSEIVIALQANVVGAVINSWSGIVGKYPSQLFALDLKRVLSDYNVSELRAVSSYRLKLSSEQQDLLILKILEGFWSYSGKYYFLSNNCATEAGSFLRSVLPTGNKFNKQVFSSPLGLLEALQESKLIAKAPDKVYESRLKPLETSLKMLGYKSSVEEYLKLPTETRQANFVALKKGDIKSKAAFILLERYALIQRTQELYEAIANNAYENKLSLGSEIRKSRASFSSDTSYGIPAAGTLMTAAEISGQWAQAAVKRAQAFDEIGKNFPQLLDQIENIKTGLKLVE